MLLATEPAASGHCQRCAHSISSFIDNSLGSTSEECNSKPILFPVSGFSISCNTSKTAECKTPERTGRVALYFELHRKYHYGRKICGPSRRANDSGGVLSSPILHGGQHASSINVKMKALLYFEGQTPRNRRSRVLLSFWRMLLYSETGTEMNRGWKDGITNGRIVHSQLFCCQIVPRAWGKQVIISHCNIYFYFLSLCSSLRVVIIIGLTTSTSGQRHLLHSFK